MKQVILFISIILAAFTVSAQVETAIKEAIQNGLKEGTSILLLQGKIDSILMGIEKYRTDSVADIRLRSYELLDFIAGTDKNKKVIERCVEVITEAQFDENFMIRNSSLGYLKKYKRGDFNSKAISAMRALTRKRNAHLLYFENILLLGFLNVHSLWLDSLANQKNYAHSSITENNVWGSKLAAARMGNKAVSKECIKIIQTGMGTDDFNYYARACDYLAYIKDISSINLLNTLLNNQNLLAALKPASDFQEPFASYALRKLREILINMPQMGKYEPYGQYTMDEIEAARKWMRRNKNNYVINTENF